MSDFVNLVTKATSEGKSVVAIFLGATAALTEFVIANY